MKIKLPEDVGYILNTLEDSGYTADIVGGCVRDSIIGREPLDYDITTSATPSEIKRTFSAHTTVDTGIRHGTVTLVLRGVPYEITTYRIDGDYADNRHPTEVRFSRDIREDLSRRDFTINAMAYSEKRGLVDLFCGKEDIERKIIRTVGEPALRFGEDALRIMRALRFSATLGFEIEEKTAMAVRQEKERLLSVSKERIFAELRRLFGGVRSYEVISEFSELFSLFDKSLSGFKMIDKEGWQRLSPLERVLSVYAINSDSEDYKNAAITLKADRRTRDFGAAVLKALPSFSLGHREIYNILIENGDEVAHSAVNLSVALGYSDEMALATLDEIIDTDSPRKISQLKIGGNDLLSLGIRGRAVGDILLWLLYEVSLGRVENECEALISHIKKCKKS